MTIPFVKMHGLGNDFVILDARVQSFQLSPRQVARIADRHKGVGCDQLIILDIPRQPDADVFMHIFNPDGSDGGACGNATRCVAWLEMQARGREKIIIETGAGLLKTHKHNDCFSVDMGEAKTGWKDIPLSQDMDTLAVNVNVASLPPATCVNMGNPHAVFFMDDVERLDVAALGAKAEHHILFPKRTNVEFAQIIDKGHIRMRVWERGAGLTMACGSGACATLVAAVRRGLTERKADIILDGGTLQIEWLENGHVLMTGPVAFSFAGELSDALLGAV